MLSVCDPAAHRDLGDRGDGVCCQNEGRRPPVQRFQGSQKSQLPTSAPPPELTEGWARKWKKMNLAMRTHVEQFH